MVTKKEKTKFKMIQIPVPLEDFEKIKSIAEKEGRTIPSQCKKWLEPHLKNK